MASRLTLLHLEWPKLYRVLAILSAIWLNNFDGSKSKVFCRLQAKLYQEKRSDLEEQQLHLNIGLQKIHDTVKQVGELQKSLSVKRIELEEKNNAANSKLKQMVSTLFIWL